MMTVENPRGPERWPHSSFGELPDGRDGPRDVEQEEKTTSEAAAATGKSFISGGTFRHPATAGKRRKQKTKHAVGGF